MVDGLISWSRVVRSVLMVVEHGPRRATKISVHRKYRKYDEKAWLSVAFARKSRPGSWK